MGGRRPGAGRKPGIIAQATARGNAAKILKKLNDEATWVWVVQTAKAANDARTVLEALKYLTDRRDGKAPQSVELSGEISYTETLAKARERLRAHRLETTN